MSQTLLGFTVYTGISKMTVRDLLQVAIPRSHFKSPNQIHRYCLVDRNNSVSLNHIPVVLQFK